MTEKTVLNYTPAFNQVIQEVGLYEALVDGMVYRRWLLKCRPFRQKKLRVSLLRLIDAGYVIQEEPEAKTPVRYTLTDKLSPDAENLKRNLPRIDQ